MPRAGLDRAAVIRAAAAVADVEGLDRVTLATVAQHLNVRPPSLYNHIAGLDDLRQGLAILGIRELTERIGRAAIGKAGDDAVVALAAAYRAFALERPGRYQASQYAPAPENAEWNETARDVVEVVVSVFAAYGLAGDDAIHAARCARASLHGFVSLEASNGFGLPLDLDQSFRCLVKTFIAGLRAGAFTANRDLANAS